MFKIHDSDVSFVLSFDNGKFDLKDTNFHLSALKV